MMQEVSMKYSGLAFGVLLATVLAIVVFGPRPSVAADTVQREQQQVSVDQIPAPVKEALEHELKGGKLSQVMQETEKKTYYEIEIDKNGKKKYVYVSPEGKVLKHESAKKRAKRLQAN